MNFHSCGSIIDMSQYKTVIQRNDENLVIIFVTPLPYSLSSHPRTLMM